jgi:membrane-associated protease RseP (regulator of RpoE activity)
VDWLGWLIFLVALLISVMWHETGHFVAAKRFGMKCTQYFIGFGPTLWSFHWGETEYGIKAIPAGGFVKIVGMTSLDEVAPEDEARSFRQHPRWQRLIVLGAGSFMHFVLAFVLIFGLAIGIGIENDNTTSLGTISACVPPNVAALNNDAPCTAHDLKSPSTIAGLHVGDQITSFNGVPVSTWAQLKNVIQKAPAGTAVAITVLRDGKTITLHTKLAGVHGLGGYLGVAPETVFQTASPLGAISYAGSGFWQVIYGTVDAVAQLPAAVPKLFAKSRSSSAAGDVTSVVGLADDTGQAVAAHVGWQYKVSFVLLLIASLNIYVGLLNLLPLLPMDGGHVFAIILERIRAWYARLRGRADPGLIDIQKLIPVSFSIFMLLAFFGVVLMIADIVNPVKIIG